MFGTTLLSLLLCTTARADEKWYALEFVVFARNNPETGAELWPGYDSTSGQPRPVAGEPGLNFAPHWLSAGALSLDGIAARLDRSPAFRVLMHSGWRQTLAPKSATAPVFLTTGPARNIDSAPPSGSTPEFNTAGTTPVRLSDASQTSPSRLTGTLRLFTTQYMRIEADFTYAARVPTSQLMDPSPQQGQYSGALSGQLQWQTQEPQTTAWAAMRLQETRGVQLGDLHYLDHPAFGIIAQVRRSSPPASAAFASPAEQQPQ